MGKNSQDRRYQKRTKHIQAEHKKAAEKILKKKSAAQELEDQVLGFSSLVMLWENHVIAIENQVFERKEYFLGKENEAAVKVCEDILKMTNTMKADIPAHKDMIRQLAIKLGETKDRTTHVERNLALLDLMEYFHESRRKFENVGRSMDEIGRRTQTILFDDPEVARKPELTNSTDLPEEEEVKVATHADHVLDIFDFGKTPTSPSPVVIDVTAEEAEQIIRDVDGEAPAEDSVPMSTTPGTAQ